MSGLEGLLTGQTLVKRYRIQEVIGRGGFAAVYRADDERLGRPVAVKVITIPAPDEAAAARHRERFEREARAAASLPQHPNVVTVHDFGIDPVLGLDFLVMEFLHGEDLATRLQRQGRPAVEEALRILRDAAAGIAVGHRAGIVHRDVKPGNIFLARGEGTDGLRVCILDFGIARLVTDEQTLTGVPGEGTPLSPAYASPEQTRGAGELTPASDVFSLGVVGYQLLTGEKPFQSPRGIDPAEWMPRRTVRQLNPKVPEGIEAVIRRALAFAPEDRYADADDFAAALAAPSDEDATLFAPPPPAPHPPAEADHTLFQAAPEPLPPRGRQRIAYGERAGKTRRSGVGPLVFLLLLLAGGAAGWWYLSGREAGAGDPSTTNDLEIIEEEFDEAGGGAATPPEQVETARPPAPADLPDSAPGGGLPPAYGLPPDTASLDVLLIDSLPQDSAPAPDSVPEDTIPVAPDTLRPPPRVLGVPVDSVGSPPATPTPDGANP